MLKQQVTSKKVQALLVSGVHPSLELSLSFSGRIHTYATWVSNCVLGMDLSAALQATLSGLLTAGMFYFISAAKPLEELSATRPHPSIFCIYFFASLLGQFAMHLTFLIVMYRCVWTGWGLA